MRDNVFPETIYMEDGKTGLTKRELFAAMAMMNLQNVLLRKSGEQLLKEMSDYYQSECSDHVIACAAVEQADALIKALAEGDSKSAG